LTRRSRGMWKAVQPSFVLIGWLSAGPETWASVPPGVDPAFGPLWRVGAAVGGVALSTVVGAVEVVRDGSTVRDGSVGSTSDVVGAVVVWMTTGGVHCTVGFGATGEMVTLTGGTGSETLGSVGNTASGVGNAASDVGVAALDVATGAGLMTTS
jgi:hypothetical protein